MRLSINLFQITKMINYHGGSFDVDDFFSVGSQQAGQQNVCEV
jgi:hypothetical protein